MTELIITRGYPASGKTTWAKNQLRVGDHARVRVNRDDLRAALFVGIHGIGTFEQESTVSVVQRNTVESLLRAGTSVIVDDTNLRAKYARAWANIAVREGARFSVVDFDTPVDECVRRDVRRTAEGGRCVGEDVILSLAQRFPMKSWHGKAVDPTPDASVKPDLYVPDVSLPAAYLVDIDGTLAHMTSGRDPYDYTRVHEDTLDREVADVIRGIEHNVIIVMSGRDESCRQETFDWLQSNGIMFDELFMRPAGDMRQDAIVKAELFDKHVRYRYNVRGVFDDRQQVVDMWRAMGLKCFQVAEGDF